MTNYVIGIDLGGHGTILFLAKVESPEKAVGVELLKTEQAKGPTDWVARVTAAIQKLCGTHLGGDDDLSVIGIGAPGAYGLDVPTITPVNFEHAEWQNCALGQMLSDAFAGTPVLVGNDVNVAAFGEAYLGSGKGHENFALFMLGTGFGGGLILNRIADQEPFVPLGEVGHVVVGEARWITAAVAEQVMLRRALQPGALSRA